MRSLAIAEIRGTEANQNRQAQDYETVATDVADIHVLEARTKGFLDINILSVAVINTKTDWAQVPP